jgi:hypothetical protein
LSIPIIDTFGVLTDEKMPFLAQALNPSSAEREMQSAEFRLPDELRTRNSELGTPLVKSIRVVRYKPGRRCLIEYKLSAPQLPTNSLTILGKVRAKGLDRKCFELMQTLWQEDFGPQRADGIHVPQPIGVIPAFQMWLQAKVPGLPATELLAGPDGVNLARRIAEGIHKLHQANLPAHRSHRMGDELRILRDRLVLVEQIKPSWSSRL